jgi:hypothetical protein
MPEAVETKADSAAAPEKAAVVKKVKAPKTAKRVKGVAVKNISDRIINTSIGSIQPGEEGRASVAETHSYSKYLEVLK